MKKNIQFKRILLKISGEFFQGKKQYGIDTAAVLAIAKELKKIHKKGAEIGIVVGGGNIYRGRNRKEEWLPEASAHQVGMMATILNAKMLQAALAHIGVGAVLVSAFTVQGIAEDFDSVRAIENLSQKKRVLVFAGGTGNPFLTTDTAAVLRALQIKADVVFKATKVDGVYSDDPMINKKAKRYKSLTFKSAIDKNLKVMDATAFTMASENNLPILVFKFQPGAIENALSGKVKGTMVSTKLS